MNKTTLGVIVLGMLAIGGIATYLAIGRGDPQAPQAAPGGRPGPGGGRALPVMAATAKRGDIDVVINALGTVTARNTAVVKARVDGQLVRINFHEGQLVQEGEVLAEIDPRPFQIALDQANGQLLRDQALLQNARLDVERYRSLLAKDSIASQQVDAQVALARQYEGTVQNDQAQVNNARLQLSFTRVTAPLSGRLGLRQIDVGNMIHAADANGIVVITQTQPVSVVFAIPSDNLSSVLARLHAGEKLTVMAYDREGKIRLATGTLLTIDNQIDVTTGTVKLKAEFTNADNALFPNQFVNARLKVETRHDAILVPAAATQRGTQGTFFYVIADDQTVGIRPVTLGPISGDMVAVDNGITAGEQVVIDGADKLKQGAKVEVATPAGRDAARKGPPRGDGAGPPGTGERKKRPGQGKDGT